MPASLANQEKERDEQSSKLPLVDIGPSLLQLTHLLKVVLR